MYLNKTAWLKVSKAELSQVLNLFILVLIKVIRWIYKILYLNLYENPKVDGYLKENFVLMGFQWNSRNMWKENARCRIVGTALTLCPVFYVIWILLVNICPVLTINYLVHKCPTFFHLSVIFHFRYLVLACYIAVKYIA